jgi:hypothetical protein
MSIKASLTKVFPLQVVPENLYETLDEGRLLVDIHNFGDDWWLGTCTLFFASFGDWKQANKLHTNLNAFPIIMNTLYRQRKQLDELRVKLKDNVCRKYFGSSSCQIFHVHSPLQIHCLGWIESHQYCIESFETPLHDQIWAYEGIHSNEWQTNEWWTS